MVMLEFLFSLTVERYLENGALGEKSTMKQK